MEKEKVVSEGRPIPESSHGTRRRSLPLIIAFIAIVLSVAAVTISSLLVYKVYVLQEEDLELRDMQVFLRVIRTMDARLQKRLWAGGVDLTKAIAQDIGNGFFVSDLSVEEYLTGVKVRGRMINATALDHLNADFEITIAESSREFSVNRIPSGNSTRFEVHVPGVALDKVKESRIRYLRSTVLFRAR